VKFAFGDKDFVMTFIETPLNNVCCIETEVSVFVCWVLTS